MAVLKSPFFMSAMPNACQPSKNPGSISTHCRYFSMALGSSPIAKSALASSNNCSTDLGISSIRIGWLSFLKKEKLKTLSQSSAVLESGNRGASSLLRRDPQPFTKHLSGEIIIEGGILRLFIRLVLVFVDWLLAIQVDQ